jgi:predicted phage-related endonuclease
LFPKSILSFRAQSNDEKWLEEREWRLTASKFGQICKATERRDMTKLANSILSPSPLNNSAVTHGRVHEQTASDKFVAETGKQVDECGLFISCEHPFLAATPDRIVQGEDALVEIKCPYKGREKKIQPGEDFPFLESSSRPCAAET